MAIDNAYGDGISTKRAGAQVIRRSPDHEDVEVTEERVIGETNQFATEIDHIAECVITSRHPRKCGEEGLQDRKLMEAI